MSNLETLQNKKVCDLESDGMEIIEIVNVDENGLVKAENVCEDKTFHVAHIRIDDEKQFEVLTEFYVNYNDLDHKEENVDENALIVTENELQGRKEEKTENTLNSDDECILEAVEDTEENDLPTLKSITCLSRSNQENRQPVKAAKPSWTRRQKTNQESPTPCKICGKMTASRSMYLRHLLKFHCGLPSSSSMENNAKSHRRTRAKEIVCRASVVARPLAKKNTSQTDYDTSAINITAKTTGPSPSLNNANPAIDQTAHSENHLMSSSSTAETDETAFEENAYYALTSPDIPATSADENDENTLKTVQRQYRFQNSTATVQKPKTSRKRQKICDLCGKLCNTESGFRHHMNTHKDPRFTCDICGRAFREIQNLMKHKKTVHSDERPFQCDVCGSNYKRKDVLQEHIKRVHEGVRRSAVHGALKGKSRTAREKSFSKEYYQCPYCYKYLASKCYLDDHVNGMHTKEKIYRCDECDMSFTRKASIKYHKQRAHVEKKRILEPRGTFLKDCEYCGLQFRVQKYYEIHVAEKHENRHACQHCDVVCGTKFQLMEHTRTAHYDKLSFCTECNKSFHEEVYLKRHMYWVHLRKTVIECHHCSYKANKKSSMASHMRRHTGEKPYECDLCSRKFRQFVDFRKHRMNHFKNRITETSMVNVDSLIQYVIA